MNFSRIFQSLSLVGLLTQYSPAHEHPHGGNTVIAAAREAHQASQKLKEKVSPLAQKATCFLKGDHDDRKELIVLLKVARDMLPTIKASLEKKKPLTPMAEIMYSSIKSEIDSLLETAANKSVPDERLRRKTISSIHCTTAAVEGIGSIALALMLQEVRAKFPETEFDEDDLPGGALE